ncbi:FMN-binding domain-containing protein [Pseudobutyrivibrio sp. ACV-2]|uniref:FMN-binding protein n=1 Tax=Pseudobutyrivibrio sp. ACV-2 TaxID=1520801 RepID=UPI0008986B44|nr:FMN-binding protein [Pseudobutyrivibrio sp. ACV-2]SEA80437.1 FMN-binding domain-containing protein [Pseudobutyrivibrio sp. ACV-2]
MIAVSVALLVSTASVAAINASGEEASEKIENPKTAEQINEETDTILKAQSCDVDMVSGATYSSEGLLDAVEAAIMQAGQ